MNGITDRQRERLEVTTANESAPTSSSTAPTATPMRSEAQRQDALDRLPVSADYRAFLAQLPAAAAPGTYAATRLPANVEASRTALVSPKLGNARDAAVQQRLDTFRDRFSGPYDVAGAKVTAQPMFRMNTPSAHNAKNMEAHAAELTRICQKAGIAEAAGPARFGRCTPEQLVKVTQALIDAGKLPAADRVHATVTDRIRGMQWEWGIGVDCAGYTQQAAAEAHGANGAVFRTASLMGDMFGGMMTDKRFTNVQIASIRPGDVIHLDSPEVGQVGHNVICYGHTMLDEKGRADLLAPNPPRALPLDAKAKEFLNGAGPFHVIDVDSSWGAGEGHMFGGFRRDTWIYSESSLSWASYPAGDRKLPLAVDPMTGPQGEMFGGAFRPRAEQ
jgi:hypothetical protein